MKTVDLHTHTTASDGTYTPTELIDYALEKGLSAIAITDHDTIGGIGEARRYREEIKAPIELIPGIELSSNVPRYPKDIHVLGYYIDETSQPLIDDLMNIVNNRDNDRIISLLNEAGVEITLDDVHKTGYEGILTRANFGMTIARLGFATDIKDAFRRYVGKGQAAYIPRASISPHKAVELIVKHGGVPVLAHPFRYGLSLDQLDTLVGELVTKGLKGIECIYPSFTEEEKNQIKDIASKHELFITGGTDFHGAITPHIDLGVGLGDMVIPYELLKVIKKCGNETLRLL